MSIKAHYYQACLEEFIETLDHLILQFVCTGENNAIQISVHTK